MKPPHIFSLLFILIFSGCFDQPEAGPYFWVADPMQRVMQDEDPGDTMTVEIWAARGEYEPFQVVVSATDKDISQVEISVSDLVGSAASINKENISIWRQHYIRVKKSSPVWEGPPNLPLGPGLYPDALVPVSDPATPSGDLPKDFQEIKKGRNQPYWIDLFIPVDTLPGRYRGTCTIKTPQGSRELDILLTVWDFQLPHRPSLRSMFGMYGSYSNGIEILLEHKLMPLGDIGAGEVYSQRDRIQYYDRKFGINTINTGRWSGAEWSNPEMTPSPDPQVWSETEDSYPREFREMLCNYTADEIWDYEDLIPPLKEWGMSMHSGSSIKNLVTTPPVPELLDDETGVPAVDIWAILPLHAQDEDILRNIEQVMEMGSEVWFYTALLQDSYSPKWLADFSPVNYRIPTWINQLYGFTGILYWTTDYWPEDPWSSFGDDDELPPGEGMLVYPGDPAGVAGGLVPSMRLKYIREGVEDYEYIKILSSLGDEEFARKTILEIARSWKDWSDDGNLLMEQRKILGERIHSIKTTGGIPDDQMAGK